MKGSQLHRKDSMLGHGSPTTEKPVTPHGSTSPEIARPSLKSRTSQLQYQSPQEMHANPYSPMTNPPSGIYSGAGSSGGAENLAHATAFKRSNSDHIARGIESSSAPPINKPQRHASFEVQEAKAPESSRPPLQTAAGSYGLMSSAPHNQSYYQASPQSYVSQANFAPFTLPPPTFPTAATSATTTRDVEPTYPTSMSTDYPSESIQHQQSGPDMMLLDQMTAPNTMPVFGGEGYNRSPFAIPEDFVAYLFSGQHMDNSSSMAQMGQHAYAKSVISSGPFDTSLLTSASSYPDAQSQYYAPYFANDTNLGGFFPPSQQPQHHPMAVTSLLDTSLPETVISEEKSQAIIDLIKERFNETDHAPVARQKEALLEGDRSEDSHMMSRKMMQTYIGSYWYHFSDQMPIRKLQPDLSELDTNKS